MNPRTTSVEFIVRMFFLVGFASSAGALFRQGGIVAIIAAIILLPFAAMQLPSVVAMLISDLRAVSLLIRSGCHRHGDYSKD